MPTPPSSMVRPFCRSLLVALLCGLAAGPAIAEPPTTAPDDAQAAPQTPPARPIASGDLDRAKLAPLVKMCAKLNERCWGPAVAETFAKAPPKELWTAPVGQFAHKDGRLVAALPDAGGMVILNRPLPPAARNTEGIRIDIWLDAQPMVMAGNAKIEFYYLALFVATDNFNPMQWDYSYLFALSRNGNMQQFQSQARGVFEAAIAGEFKKDKLTHVRMEIIGQYVLCRRDDNKPLVHRSDQLPLLRTDDKTAFGLMGQCKRLRVAKVVVRALAPAVDPAALADQWKLSPFADQSSLTACLADRVIPRLDDPRFQVRREAADLLTSLWPLSRPAIEAAAKGPPPGFTAEGVLGLEALRLYSPPVTVVTTQPDEEADRAPTTQPEAKR